MGALPTARDDLITITIHNQGELAKTQSSKTTYFFAKMLSGLSIVDLAARVDGKVADGIREALEKEGFEVTIARVENEDTSDYELCLDIHNLETVIAEKIFAGLVEAGVNCDVTPRLVSETSAVGLESDPPQVDPERDHASGSDGV